MVSLAVGTRRTSRACRISSTDSARVPSTSSTLGIASSSSRVEGVGMTESLAVLLIDLFQELLGFLCGVGVGVVLDNCVQAVGGRLFQVAGPGVVQFGELHRR